MKISELKNIELGKEIAYVLGLIFPLFKIVNLEDKDYIVGSVNHNQNLKNSDDINIHYFNVFRLLNSKDINIDILANQSSNGNISRKAGFSVIIECDLSIQDAKEIMCQVVSKIQYMEYDIKKYFIMGCFDGRSSWDRSSKYLSIDVDRDYAKQDIIETIANSLNIELNKNRRAIDHKKNDQIRVKNKSLDTYYNKVGFLSEFRRKIISNVLNMK